jgi:serine/threonine-protein kinase
MGVVYKAEDRSNNQIVALKVLHPWLRADPESRARFIREGKAVERLNHRTIARMHEFGEVELADGRTLFMAMEFVPGRDLQQRQSVEGFDQQTVVEIGIQLAEALEAAHEQGIVHRDLKPANVKITRDGEVKVLDFGLAKILSDPETGDDNPSLFESKIGVILGTAPYSAPEQMMGETSDPRADLFSLGVILYQMVTERVPFRGANAVDMLAEHQQGPESPREIVPALAPGLSDLILRLLAVRPSERFQSATEVLKALEKVRSQESAALARTLEQSSVAEHLDLESVASPGDRPVPLWLVAVVLVAVVATIAWFAF